MCDMYAVYELFQGEAFRVDAGSLGFSVSIYSITAVICIVTLLIRRFTFSKAELGGVMSVKVATFILFVFMWFMYIILSSMQVYGNISGF